MVFGWMTEVWSNVVLTNTETLKGYNDYLYRMTPHLFGWIPISAAWLIICVFLERLRSHIRQVHNREFPAGVVTLIYGTMLLFFSFAFVQIVFQLQSFRKSYWATEVVYCLLSLSSKLWLGIYILTNVIMTNDTVEDVLSVLNETASVFA